MWCIFSELCSVVEITIISIVMSPTWYSGKRSSASDQNLNGVTLGGLVNISEPLFTHTP